MLPLCQMLMLHFIPVMALIVQNGYTMGSAVYRQQRMLFLIRTVRRGRGEEWKEMRK